MFGGKMGVMELIIILVIVLVVFGPKQLPKLSKMFGKTVKNFKEGMEEENGSEAEKETEAVKAEAAAKAETAEKADAPKQTE